MSSIKPPWVGAGYSPILPKEPDDELLRKIQMAMGQGGSAEQAKPTNVVSLNVTKVINGYVLTISGEQYIARDMDELQKMFVTALVARKLGE